jgi:hypothetical protein
MINHMSSVKQAHDRLPSRFKRQLVQAHALAKVSCPLAPLALIEYAARLQRWLEKVDRIHARTCVEVNCPADDLDDQLMSLRRLLAMEDEPDLVEVLRGILATYDDRRSINAHLGGQDTAFIVRSPKGEFRWRLVRKGVAELSDRRYPSRREAERALAEFLRG